MVVIVVKSKTGQALTKVQAITKEYKFRQRIVITCSLTPALGRGRSGVREALSPVIQIYYYCTILFALNYLKQKGEHDFNKKCKKLARKVEEVMNF